VVEVVVEVDVDVDVEVDVVPAEQSGPEVMQNHSRSILFLLQSISSAYHRRRYNARLMMRNRVTNAASIISDHGRRCGAAVNRLQIARLRVIVVACCRSLRDAKNVRPLLNRLLEVVVMERGTEMRGQTTFLQPVRRQTDVLDAAVPQHHPRTGPRVSWVRRADEITLIVIARSVIALVRNV